ncbi:MAG TPA: ATP-binding protein [Acidobacteriaceae bacterium]|nr:ATP-binding protein [Acidobacteriaceae bacterium]
MRLKTKLVLAITGLVFLVVTVLSWLFLEQLLAQRITQSYAANDMVAHQVLYYTQLAVTNGLNDKAFDPNDPKALRAAVAEALQHDQGLNEQLSAINRYSPTVYDVSIADSQGRALLSTDPTQDNVQIPKRENYDRLLHGGVFTTVYTFFGPPRTYNIVLLLERGHRPFLSVQVGIRTTFLRNVFAPWIWASLTFTGIAILSSLLVAALLANLALQPIEQISLRLDTLEQANFDNDGEPSAPEPAKLPPPREAPAWMRPATLIRPSTEDTVVQVSDKIERIGRRMRNVEEVFSALKENLDSIMSNLQDGILLFTAEGRAALVSDSVERFLGLPRTRLFGGSIDGIFTLETKLGRLVRDAFENGHTLDQEEVETDTGRRVQVSLDFVIDQDSAPGASLGALLTLHDLESVRELESELELSRRLAAIGRLTAGVGHEVKNPINAIVVHLELLRNKLSGPDARAMRHLEIIESEIQRLDRVVQTLVDFSRPVELQLKEQDLRRIVSGVLMLASAELETHNVRVSSHMPERPLITKVDADLIKQAILNVVLNGAQAMSQGGELHVTVREEGRMAAIEIADSGSGIPDDIRAKIFDLYFTTRKDGSGIGLAMTYRIMQLHNGSIDVQSEQNIGSTFTLKLPLLASAEGKLRGSQLDTTTSAPAFTSEGSGL